MTEELKLVKKAKDLAYFFLKFRPRTEKELQEHLVKKKRRHKLTPQSIVQALKELKEERLVDDVAFIAWHVERRSRGKPKAKIVLTHELIKYGIQKELIDEFFQVNEFQEAPLAKQALQSKWLRWNRLPKEKRFEKAARFLQSRGFSYGITKNTIEELEEKEYNSLKIHERA